MQQTAQHLMDTVERAMPLLQRISVEEARIKPAPEKWSKLEVLGHLIDSASNNHQKFVRTMQADQHLDFVGYDQNFWVDAQGYNTINWATLLVFWESYNRHLAHLIRNAAPEKLGNTISIDGSQSFTLGFIMADYVEHLKHHLNQILPEAGFTSAFENLYNT